MKTDVIVSLADEKYFDLLIELIDSIKKNQRAKTQQFVYSMQE